MEWVEAQRVDIWLADLDAQCRQETCAALLAPEERERMRRFHFPRDARRFALGRAMLRIVLGRYLDRAPESLCFTYGEWGKPRLPESGAPYFNLSHAGPLALLAVAPFEIGVDIEAKRDDIDVRAVARVFMSEPERAHLDSLGERDRQATFFAYWCCKEAYMKACGLGMSLEPTRFTVSLDAKTAQLQPTADMGPQEAARWAFHRLAVPPGYDAALVCDNAHRPIQINMRSFTSWPAQTDSFPT